LSLGYVGGTTIDDGTTGNQWRLGYTAQIRATFEKTIQRGVTAGVSAGFSTPPIDYIGTSFNSFASCGGECLANADVAQYLAFIRVGGGMGIHALYNAEAGVTEFSNFRTQSTNAILDPTSPAYDFTFGLGGGVAYGFSATADAYVEEEGDFVLHPQGNTVTTAAPHEFTLRAGFRVGF
jgi:hypothetical protein